MSHFHSVSFDYIIFFLVLLWLEPLEVEWEHVVILLGGVLLHDGFQFSLLLLMLVRIERIIIVTFLFAHKVRLIMTGG